MLTSGNIFSLAFSNVIPLHAFIIMPATVKINYIVKITDSNLYIVHIDFLAGRELTPPVLNRRENGTGVSKMWDKMRRCGLQSGGR